MHVLVTGGAGYIGSVLVPLLISHGYRVRVVDCGMFGFNHLDPRAEVIEGDILDFRMEWLHGVEAVIHLAGLSNDPMAAFSPSLNYLLNAAGTAIVAQYAKAAGVVRFIFGSTCSVYGLNDRAEVDENENVNPSFPYAISKLMAERAIACLTDKNFRPIILRKGTVVGWSPRMRFDLVVNAMVKSALTKQRIDVHNPNIWRPLLDVRDAARAYIHGLQADPSITGIFNVAEGNYMIGHLAKEVASALRECGIDVSLNVEHRIDVRSYRVSTSKTATVLNFHPTTSIKQVVQDIVRNIQRNGITDFDHPRYYNVEQLKIKLFQGAVPWVRIRLNEPGASLEKSLF